MALAPGMRCADSAFQSSVKGGGLLFSPEFRGFQSKLIEKREGPVVNLSGLGQIKQPSEKILGVSKRRHTDLIVMGARPSKVLATHFEHSHGPQGCLTGNVAQS